MRKQIYDDVRRIGHVQMVQTLQAQTDLDLGECAAIVLAQELKALQLLIDDLDARKIAIGQGIAANRYCGRFALGKREWFNF